MENEGRFTKSIQHFFFLFATRKHKRKNCAPQNGSSSQFLKTTCQIQVMENFKKVMENPGILKSYKGTNSVKDFTKKCVVLLGGIYMRQDELRSVRTCTGTKFLKAFT